ncbi:MAG: bifunctional 3,4-dihydroxy-2-butanone-4-phosphate synthase/GTP cyclohydrolase II [Pseudonocardia sp.]|uniref:bifunctional 3,4-dihydroxy-2-butanone-4-phosphate synthase/GTP cyclohydrolase II n=1 Tax=unclassified Pseudonocardia TaxID=2619320 RepID=UPI00086867C3|nr:MULTISPECIES: bifunctional 3,4-dihydroxy-2-butanone-4-phosphate synthase/GTP cyclohydrolase II [unclassified Pseudonocardia]MBN9112460.1 bifunctional 3,4-dihydroxy-2-butanone-4-phosphate synthase/GTP cyclohydrolase II [Pseudonocardia sp.]ODU27276.1 MAG: bifunctional 3,4-dihydroxy-2-butanone 4-phosphate synthase/GTP cyclohydrolase II [Pseudonocardia sp. SCN 72-51]ODV08889.1 MAG: bifunctional 3,4-dihydroxy-2-butanone 4-phosphate synthase/GTP cyclohydrolase II [Pseudonocardia sp. SCN 73-27]
MLTGPRDLDGVVDAALSRLRSGGMVLVVDDEDRENEGDLVMAAEFATPEKLAFIIAHTSGIVCVAVTNDRADELDLPLMTRKGDDPRGTAFTISVDRRLGTTTGVSAADRSATVLTLADPSARPRDLCRPGHVFPLRARPGGVLQRAGHTEAAVDLCRLAGLPPIGVLAEVTNPDGSMARCADLREFGARHDIPLIAVADLVRYRNTFESLVHRESSGPITVSDDEWTAVAYTATTDDVEHVALVLGDVDQRSSGDETPPILVRVHSECLTGDVFGSRRCDCGEQLASSLARIARAGRGVVVYLRGHEGRGIGLAHKLRAYTLQDRGLDTIDANLAQGLPADSREYGVGAQILLDLGVRTVRLMTNNPDKVRGLSGYGVDIVEREPVDVPPNPANLTYLTTKRERMAHMLRLPETS